MASYKITSSAGVDLGTREAESPEAAIEAMHQDAGYRDSEHAADALGTTVDALCAELTIVLVESQWSVGDRVEGGDTAEDYDTGRVSEVDGDRVLVAWGSEVRTWADANRLRAEGERPIAR